MKSLITILFLFSSILVQSQDMATFGVGYIHELYEQAPMKRHEELKNWEWIINGKPMTIFSGSITVKADSTKLDTILFRVHDTISWDVIICNIKYPKRYEFDYNECCGYFDIISQNIDSSRYARFTSNRVLPKVSLKVLSAGEDKYISTYGSNLSFIDGSAYIIKADSTHNLVAGCKSYYSPTIAYFTIEQIEECSDTPECYHQLCMPINGEQGVFNYGFKVIKTVYNVHFMPLQEDETFKVIFDPMTREVIVGP